MKSFCLYIFLMTAVLTASQAQDIYAGGRGDGFSSQLAGASIFAGGGSSGFAFDTLGSLNNEVSLPVTWLAFTAQPQDAQVLLRWQTATESNNDRFEVERSIDGAAFQWLTNVAGRGNSILPQSYQAIDPHPYPGINYYRLKQVDYDGDSRYSSIVSVNIAQAATTLSLRIYPNPADQTIHIGLTSLRNTKEIVSLYNAAGMLLAKRRYVLASGFNRLTLDISQLGAGTYFIKGEHGGLPAVSFIKK